MRRWVVLSMLVGCDPEPPAGSSAPLAATPTSAPAATTPMLPSIPAQYEIDALGPGQRGRRVTVHGYLVEDTTERKPGTQIYRFGLARRGAVLRVEYTGALPQDFVEQREVIATGILGLDGTTLVADEVISRCPDDYEELKRATP